MILSLSELKPFQKLQLLSHNSHWLWKRGLRTGIGTFVCCFCLSPSHHCRSCCCWRTLFVDYLHLHASINEYALSHSQTNHKYRAAVAQNVGQYLACERSWKAMTNVLPLIRVLFDLFSFRSVKIYYYFCRVVRRTHTLFRGRLHSRCVLIFAIYAILCSVVLATSHT